MPTAEERALEALHKHLPHLAGEPLARSGSGLDNVTYRVGDVILRVAGGDGVDAEARLLQVVAARAAGIAVPVPLFADPELDVLAYPYLSGTSLLGRTAPAGAAAQLGTFLRQLHSIEPGEVEQLVEPEEADPSEWLADLEGTPTQLRLLADTVPPPSDHRVLVHGDLGAEHLLSDGTAITGIIDWSDAALADPALDFARLYRDFGPSFLDQVLRAYGGLDDSLPRIEYHARCAALEDLAFGLTTDRPEYAETARRSIAWLFPE